jgi:photosystem II stability/assembly factor-like uncharacterized protein
MRRSLFLLLFVSFSSRAPGQEVIARLFAATSEGSFLSYSWGEHWERLRGDLRGFEGQIDAFACLGPTVFAGGSAGLFVSDDFGETFHRVATWPGDAPEVTRFLAARLFALEPTLFVGTRGGLYRTNDSGHEWQRVGASEISSAVRDMSWPGPELFVASDSGLHRSVDKGERWVRMGAGLPSAPLLSLAISRYFPSDPLLFAGTAGKGVYRSGDGGEHFEPVGAVDVSGATVRALFWWGSLLLVGTDDGLFLSEDGGKKFRKAKELSGVPILSISVPGAEAEISSDIILGTTRGVYKSSDVGQSFRSVQEGMGPVEVRSLATFPAGPHHRERRSR